MPVVPYHQTINSNHSSDVDINSNSNFSTASRAHSSRFQSYTSSQESIQPVLEDGYNYEYERQVAINKVNFIDNDRILANTYEAEKRKVDSRSLMSLFYKSEVDSQGRKSQNILRY